MTVLDASALMAALLGEPARKKVEAILRSREDRPKISAISLAEVIDGITRVGGRPAGQVNEAIDWLRAGGLVVVPVTEQIGRDAGTLRAANYHRGDAPLSLADCVALATCRSVEDPLATTDALLAATAQRLGVEILELVPARQRRR